MNTYSYAHTYAYTITHTYMHTCTYTHKCMNTHAVTCMHTHMHKGITIMEMERTLRMPSWCHGVDERRLELKEGLSRVWSGPPVPCLIHPPVSFFV